MRNVFMGPERLRAGWRFAIFVVVLVGFQALLQGIFTATKTTFEPGFAPAGLLRDESLSFVLLLAATALMLPVDRRRSLAEYGITLRGALGARFWTGFLLGLAIVGAIVGAIALCGGVHYEGWRYTGAALVRMTLLWFAANLGIGLAEEVMFRGYALRVLTDGMGFWPAAILLSLVFGALHYFGKPFETWVDFASVGLIGLFLCWTVRRTGDLWWAIGFHAGFDFAQLGWLAGPNSGNGGVPVAQSLLVPRWHGAPWLTGGKLGIEASLFVFPALAVLAWTFGRMHRAAKFPPRALAPALAIVAALALPAGRAHAASATWRVFAVRYATVKDFPVSALVAGADTTRTSDIAMMFWLLEGPKGRRVLVDAGFHRRKFLNDWKPAAFVKPSEALAAFGGRAPESVTDIVISHVHWDHLDGADLFPRATIWIQREEYEYYVDADGGAKHGAIDSVDARMLYDLKAAGRVRLVDGDAKEILPGITVYTGGKHTYQSQYAGVRTAKGTVVVASDNCYLYENLTTHAAIAQTLDAASNLAAQERMRKLAAVERLIVPGHDPEVFTRFPAAAPGVARIE